MNTNSAIIWQGRSPKDGRGIVAIISGLTKPSDNDKTGPMAQVDILVADTHPVEARKLGHDTAVCGDCPLKTVVCYVNVGFGPSAKYRAFQRGSYQELTPWQVGGILWARGIGVRLGAYGDPAMVPFEVWDDLLYEGIRHTGYTHQWKEDWFDPRHLEYCMGSIDQENTREQFKALYPEGRTYRLGQDYDDMAADEIACPSKRDGVRVVQCADCGLCAGESLKAKDIVIVEGE